MKQRYVILLGLAIGFTSAFAQQKAAFSIDDVLSAPYCSNLTPGRSRMAWVVTTEVLIFPDDVHGFLSCFTRTGSGSIRQ